MPSPKPKAQTKPRQAAESASNSSNSSFWLVATDIIARVGIPGFLVIAMVFAIFSWPSTQQHEEIIDRWVLLKNNSGSQMFTITVIIFAIVIYLLEAIAFTKIRKLDREEIDRLSHYKKLYQEHVLDQPLQQSSKT